ncbi:MAG TPA: methionine--tRNA ligase, partial [Propionibacteriaceae bacterium]|nr:methionine--tRNA ligase [Propionibacteriaceae bacterium]
VPEPGASGVEAELQRVIRTRGKRYQDRMGEVALSAALGAVWEIVDAANHYLVQWAPWKLAEDPARRAELATVLYASAEVLRVLAVLISPAMPEAAARLWEQLGMGEPLEGQRLPEAASWGGLEPGTRVRRGDALFPRLEA